MDAQSTGKFTFALVFLAGALVIGPIAFLLLAWALDRLRRVGILPPLKKRQDE